MGCGIRLRGAGKHNDRGYDLMSMGPDGKAGGDDDIVNWAVAEK